MNYYEHHLGDYARDTAHLSILQDGAYRRLLDLYYIREAPLPEDARHVCRLLRATSRQEKLAVEAVLQEFFHLESDGWHHKRCDLEIARFREKSARAKVNAEKRWAEAKSASAGNAGGMRSHCDGTAIQSPPTSPQAPENKTEDRACDELDRLEGALRHAAGTILDPLATALSILDRPLAWAREGCDLEMDVLPAIRAVAARASPGSVRSWKYFDRAVSDAKSRRLAPLPEGRVNEQNHFPSRSRRIQESHFSGIADALAEARCKSGRES